MVLTGMTFLKDKFSIPLVFKMIIDMPLALDTGENSFTMVKLNAPPSAVKAIEASSMLLVVMLSTQRRCFSDSVSTVNLKNREYNPVSIPHIISRK